MSESLRILVVEDNPADADLIRELLPQTGRASFHVESVARLAAALPRLQGAGIDLVLLDLGLPDSQGLATLRQLHQAAPDVPVIVLTGNDDRELGVAAVQEGAQDYLVKGQNNPNLLDHSIRYALERQKLVAKLHASEEHLRLVTTASADGLWDWNLKTGLAQLSPSYCEISGYGMGEVPANLEFFRQLVHPQDWPAVIATMDEHLAGKSAQSVIEYRIVTKDGTEKWIWGRGKVVERAPDGTPLRMAGTITDITARKQAEQSLRESQRFLQSTLDALSAHVAILDEHGTIIKVNAAWNCFARENNLSRDIVGQNYLHICDTATGSSSAGAAAAVAGIRKIMAGLDEVFELEYPCHSPQEQRWFTLRVTRFAGEGPVRVVVAHENITTRKQAVDKLTESTTQLLEAQRIARLGSYVLDVSTEQWTSSQVLDELFGIVDSGFTKDVKGWLELVHPDERAELSRYLTGQVLERKVDFDRTYRVIRQNDRQERWVHGLGKLVLDDHGRVVKMVGVIRDITEGKRDQEHLKVQIGALTAAANAIVITTHEGMIEWVNPAFTRLTGYSAEEAIGGNLRMLKSGEHPRAFYGTLWATILTGNVWYGELINKRKDGGLYTEEMTVTPVRGADGQIAHFVAVKQDITERRQMEKRMLQAQKMEAIGQLAGGIAHDFNNMLAALFGYAHLLQQDTVGNPLAQESVTEILVAANRAKELVQQILSFSRQREQKPQVIKLDIIVKEALKFLRASLPAHIKIEKELSAETPAVVADPTQIYQVTMNLATNALHAMEDAPGRLLVRLDPFQPDEKLIQAHPELKPILYARLTVTDTGHGMDAKTLDRIFEPFFTTKPAGKGTGLGLAVVHGIVESHHGVITVESQVGQGTTFTLYFPAQAQAETLTATDASAVPHGHGQRILAVDDEPALTSVLQKMLHRLDYQVTTSNQASEAIRLVREHPAQFDLVITDLTMPEMNGLEVAKQLHAIRLDLPVILVSGYSVSVAAERLREAGICERLDKPISPSAIAEAVARVLKKL